MQKHNLLIQSKIHLTMEYAITKISSKGQIVIPSELRTDLKEGEKLLIIKHNNQLVLKQLHELDKQFAEDMEFAKATEDAWKEIQQKKGTAMEFDECIKEIEKW